MQMAVVRCLRSAVIIVEPSVMLKKIIYIHQYFNSPSMSGSTRSYEQAKRLAAAGYDVTIFTSARVRQSQLFRTEFLDGFNVIWVNVSYSNEMGFLRRIISFFIFSLLSSIFILFKKYDVVIATSTPLTVAIPGIIAKLILGKKFIFEVRDLWPEIPIALGILKNPILIYAAKYLAKLAYDRSDHIIALSPGMADGIVNYRIATKKVSVIPNGCDNEFFTKNNERSNLLRKKINITDEVVLFVYCGALGYVNGVSYIVDLAESSSQFSNIAFVVIGEGREKEQIINAARKKNVLNKNFFLLDPVPKLMMPSVLDDADISCSVIIDVKALEANSANKFFDSLASGSCVALNHGGWQADLIREHAAGIILDRDTTVAARQLQEFIGIPGMLSSTKVNARSLAEKQFDRDILGKQLVQIISSIDN